MARKAGQSKRKDSQPAGPASEEAGPNQASPRRKTTRSRKAKTKNPRSANVRMKMCWAVVTSTMRQVALYEYACRAEADERAAQLTEKHKSPHFVLPVRLPVEDAAN